MPCVWPLQQRLMQESGVSDLLTGDERSLPGRVLDAGPGLEALLGLLRSVSRAISVRIHLLHYLKRNFHSANSN